jgi:hypothetical protein
MDKNHGKQRAIPEVEKGGIYTKEIGIRELKHGACNSRNKRDIRVSDTKLVEVIEVGQSKDQRREEDDGLETGTGGEEERDSGRPEQTLFCDGTLAE